MLGSCPGWEWWLLAAADEYLAAGDTSAAIHTADQAITAGKPEGWVLRAYIGSLASNDEETDSAIAQAAASQDGTSHHALGRFHRELDETEKADSAYRRATELGCSDAWGDWAALWHDAGDIGRRDAVVSEALKTSNIRHLRHLAEHYADTGARHEARIQALLSAEHGECGPGHFLVRRWENEGATDDALAVAHDLARVGFPSAIEELIGSAADSNDTERVIRYAEAHLALGSLYAAKHLLPAYAATGDQTSFEHILRQVCDSPTLLLAAGAQCAQAGLHADAHSLLGRARTLGAADALIPLARLHKASGRNDDARRLLYEAVDAAVPNALKELVEHCETSHDHTTAQALQRWGVTQQKPAAPW
ncbi:hypothetical protein ACFVVP_37480 [Streptomyces sp. NPDC058128]|uniref:hypothetical protein n=1 Tax=Streptomyces sp. NPDC058128 TaxID=3346352 RepID=UPI0036EA7181